MSIEFVTESPEQTEAFAQKLGEMVSAPCKIFLKGDMGAGKTVFAKAFAKGAGCEEETSSPTYTLVNTYDGYDGPVYHMDLYRLNDYDEFEEAGLEDLYQDEEGISIIEWPEILEPDFSIDMEISIVPEGEKKRRFYIDGNADSFYLLDEVDEELYDDLGIHFWDEG